MNEGMMMRLAAYLAVATRVGDSRASSHTIGTLLHLNASQVRRDLMDAGITGTRGVGYKLSDVEAKLRVLLTPMWGEVVQKAAHDRLVSRWILEMTYPPKES